MLHSWNNLPIFHAIRPLIISDACVWHVSEEALSYNMNWLPFLRLRRQSTVGVWR